MIFRHRCIIQSGNNIITEILGWDPAINPSVFNITTDINTNDTGTAIATSTDVDVLQCSIPQNSGKRYFEITTTYTGSSSTVNAGIGTPDILLLYPDIKSFYMPIATAGISNNNVSLGSNEGGAAWWAAQGKYTCAIAVDLDAHLVWMGGNANYYGLYDGTNLPDPVLGLSGAPIPTGDYVPKATLYQSGTSHIINTVGSFLYGPPAGFVAWNTVI